MVLLYADALGMKARWRLGVETIRTAYDQLEQLVSTTFIETGTDEGAEGGVQSDAVAITFPTTAAALQFGRRLFSKAFFDATETDRLWLRGVLMPCSVGGLGLAREEDIGRLTGVRSRQFCDELLAAINVEQRFKGPRLLLAESLVTRELQDTLALRVGTQFIVPLKRLRHSTYPESSWRDVLYLYPEDISDATMRRRSYEVGQRQRWAAAANTAGSPDEFEHLSHLALLWTQCDAIYHAKTQAAITPAAQYETPEALD